MTTRGKHLRLAGCYCGCHTTRFESGSTAKIIQCLDCDALDIVLQEVPAPELGPKSSRR